MYRRNNFENTMKQIMPDDIVLDLGGNPLSSMEGQSQERLLEYLGYTAESAQTPLFGKVKRIDERILTALDIDTRSVGEIIRPERSQFKMLSADEYIDEWGIHRKFSGMYWDIVQNPLKGASCADLDEYDWPEADSLDIKQIESFTTDAKRLYSDTDYVICAEHPVYGVFELGCWLCGFDDFLIKMCIDTDFVHKLFEIILEYQKKVIEVYYGLLGKYIHYTSSGDDFATQNSLFMAPEMFRSLIKPYLGERIRYTKKYTDAYFLHHSCGNVYEIISDLIEIGVEILNPIQPVSAEMSPASLKEGFGDQVVLHGGMDTQLILPNGDAQSINSYIKESVGVFSQNGGYIFAAAHNIQDDVPPENVYNMFRSARKYGRKLV